MKPLVPPGRVVGLDVARALALLGMMATHILAPFDEDGITVSQQVAGGRASALFAILAGTSLALMSGRTRPARGQDRLAVSAGLAVRALAIAGIGLLLGEVDSGIAVILTYYGVLFLLGLPFLGLGARTLALLSGVWLVVAPVVSHLRRPHLPPRQYASPALDQLTDPWQLLTELTFTGYYPAFPWLAYLLAGMAIGRMDLSRWRTSILLAVSGVAVAVSATAVSDALLRRPGVATTLEETFTGPGWFGNLGDTLAHGLYGSTPTGSWWWLAVRAPHTATPFDLAATIGSTLLVVGVCLAAGKVLPRLLAVVFGAGAMTLTLYSAHVVLRAPGLWDADTTGTYLGQVTAVLVVGAVYRLARRRGPLEAALAWASSQTAGAVRRRPSTRART